MNVDPLPTRDTPDELVRSLQRQIGQLQRRRPTIDLPIDTDGPPLVCVAVRTTSQAINNATGTVVSWSAAPVNPDGLWDSTQPTRINLTEPGEWEISYDGTWDNTGTTGTSRTAAVNFTATADTLPAVRNHAVANGVYISGAFVFLSAAGFCRVMVVRPTAATLFLNHASAVNPLNAFADANNIWTFEARRVGPLRA